MASKRGERAVPQPGRKHAHPRTLPRPTRAPEWDEGSGSDSEEYERRLKRTTEKRNRLQSSRDSPDALPEVPANQADIKEVIEKLVHGRLRSFAEICAGMRYIQDHHPDFLDKLRERVGISDDALGLIAHGPGSEIRSLEHEERPSLRPLRSKGSPGSPATQPPSPDPRSAGATLAETDEAPRAQQARPASAHRTAPNPAAGLTSAPPGHGSSVPAPLSQLPPSSVWSIDPSHRNHGLQPWIPGQQLASGAAIHVGAQPGGPPAAMVHGAQAPQSTPSAAGPMPPQPPHGNIVSVPPNGGLPANLTWSNAGAAYPLFLAQPPAASGAQHGSGSGPSVVAPLPRQGVSNLDGLQSHPPQASLPPHLANMISAPTMQLPSNPFSYAQPGPFHMSTHSQGPWATGVTQQALDGTLLDQGDSTNYANMSLL